MSTLQPLYMYNTVMLSQVCSTYVEGGEEGMIPSMSPSGGILEFVL